MHERFEVNVTFDQQRGYIASHPDLPVITALSLRTLRRRVDVRLIGEDVDVRLLLDRAARIERDARRASSRFLPPTRREPHRWPTAARAVPHPRRDQEHR